MNWKRFFVALFTALLLLPSVMMAQSVVTGGIAGVVSDPTGAVVVGATMNLRNPATGAVLTSTTGSSGVFQFTLLKPGTYTLSATQQGFKQASEVVEILLGQTATANFKLELGSGSITVEVTGQGAMLQTEDANISSNFDTKQIENVPNPGGDITYVAQTAPGVTMNNAAGGGYGNFSVFGLPGSSNLFTVNGNDYNDAFLNLNNSGSSNLLLGGNELQEVAVVANAYTGQYGRQAGAQVDYSTKSGTNSLHGDLVYNWTGRALNANDPINKAFGGPRPFENNNQWAASIGGPIFKDKLFFFVNTEGIRYIFASVKPVTIPTPAFESFVLGQSQIASDPATLAFYTNAFNLWSKAPGASGAIANASSCGDLPVAGGECTAGYTQAAPNGNREWLVSGRIDLDLNENNKIFGRLRFDRGVQPTYTDTIDSIFNATSNQPQDEGQLNYTHIFSPTVVNNFVASTLFYSAVFGNFNPGAALAQFPGVLNFQDGSLTNLGVGSGQGGFANAFFFPQGRRVEQWQIIDDVSVARGNHAFKMGVNFRRDDVTDLTGASNALYPAVNVTLDEFASDQIAPPGCAAPGVQDCGNALFNFIQNPEQPVAYTSFGLYFQDEYRVNSKLKFTLTLRADRNTGGVCQIGCAGYLTNTFQDIVHGATVPYDAAFGGSVLTGQHTILPNVEKVVFQPRVGMAWSPFGQNTVIRTGVGLFSDLYPGEILSFFDLNSPVLNAWTVPAGTVAFDTASPTSFPTSGVSLVTQCNTAFTSNFLSGGSLTTGGTSGGGYAGAASGIPGGCLNALGNLSVPNINDNNHHILNPKYLEWNFEVQHTFGSRTVVSANYVGNHGFDILMQNGALNGFGFGDLPAAAPDPRFGFVREFTNAGYSNYNGLTFSIQENAWHGLSGRFNYTYSHELDNTSNGGINPFSVFFTALFQADPYNPHQQYASGDNDARHQVSASYVYELPFKSESRLMNAAIGGWMISGTMFYRTGFPFPIIDGGEAVALAGNNVSGLQTILMRPEFSQTNFSNGGACVVNGCFFVPASGGGNPTGPFAGNVFAPSTSFLGSARNSFFGPGFLGGDMTLKKTFTLTERMNMQLAFNVYNFLNHANYGPPYANTNFGLGAFGHTIFTETPPTSPYGAFASAATDMRMAQITAKFTF